jgi:hypothetical protein
MIHNAIPGVAAAFVLNFIMLCIYAVLAVDFFKDIHNDCHEREVPLPGSITARGKCFGEDYYGTFLRALYTLFQILTGESWSEAGVRPVLHYYEDSWVESGGSAFFFISFVLINAVVLLNVVVAVLIEGMSHPDDDEGSDSVNCQPVSKQTIDDGQNSMEQPMDPSNSVSTKSANCKEKNSSKNSKNKDSVKRTRSETENAVANEAINKNIGELQDEVGELRQDLLDVPKQVQDSCQTMMSLLQEHREHMARSRNRVMIEL